MYAKKGSKFIIIVSFIICFAFCITLADFFSNLITIRAFNSTEISTKSPAYSIYAISLHSSTTKSTASDYSVSVIKQGGAGYVLQQNENYYVLASAYANMNDATLVKTNLEESGLAPSIVEIKVDEINFSGTFSKPEQSALGSAICIYKSVYDKLYDISVELDTSVKTENESKLAISDLESDLSKISLNFDAQFSNKLTTTILYVKLSLKTLSDEISSLVQFDSSSSQNFSSKIKSTYLEAITLNKDLAESVGK